jgi:signal transduction histidine kinase/ActR/RegA family two-component response regulator
VRLLIGIMIFAGSGLMVYNIIRYGTFVKNSRSLEQQSVRNGLLITPLLLLIFFLIGYVIVGLSGIANLLIAGILLGGSIFVFILLLVMFSIIRHVRDTDQVLAHRYEEMRAELNAITRDSLAAFLVNLTRDEIEERAGTYLYDSDYLSDTYSDMLRARGEYVLEADFAGPENSKFRRERLLQLYSEGQTFESEEILVRRKDGEAGYVRFEATLSKMPVSGDIVGFFIERPYNEEVVRRTLLQRVMMDQYDRIAYMIDGKYRVVISNAGKKKTLLLPDDEDDTYESLYLNYILPAMPKDRDRNGAPNPLRLSVIDRALARDPVYDVNAPFIIEGETRYKHIIFYRIDGRAKFYLMLIADSTQLQEEQKARNQQLSDALEQAVHAREAQSRFFSRVSRDLQNPVDSILQSAAAAAGEGDRARTGQYLEKIGASGRQLRNLLEDLLAMSQIDSGSLELEEKPADLRMLAEGLMEQFASEKREKQLSFHTEASGLRRSAVLCDEERLRRVLSRLLENSCAFAPDGGTISLTVSQGEAAEGEKLPCEFCIRNGGVKIPPDALEHIFEEDSWADNSHRDQLPGVGLGMMVAKAFVDSMGGSIHIRSGEDGDVSVRIELAFLPVPAEAADDGAQSGGEGALHVLLVDDNEINREIGELMLTGEGWTVDLAADGGEAVAAVSAAAPGTFDLVLMDVNMPVMNGYEATAAIRALPDPALAGIPIVALTANAFREEAKEALQAGMNGFVSKPIDPAAIRRELERIRSGK